MRNSTPEKTAFIRRMTAGAEKKETVKIKERE